MRMWLLVCVAVVLGTAAVAEPLLKPGDRMVFLGDDITEQFTYTRYVMTFVAQRYPGAKISFRNAAWSGNTAADALARLQRDVLSLRPSVVSVCFGLNDGRFTAFTQANCDAYLQAMQGITAALKKENIRVVLLTPACVDPERRSGGQEYNATLIKFAAALKGWAEKEGVPCFDLNTLMLAVQARAKQDDVRFTLLPDGIHPNNAGQLVIAYALIKALGVIDQPSALTIDAPRKLVTHDACKVTDLAVSDTAVTFTRTDDALPAYVDPEAAKVLPYLPFIEELNQYRLQVHGLQEGTWQVTAGDIPVGVFTAQALGKGVNLANVMGPWTMTGMRVAAGCNDQEFLYYARWRQFGLNPIIPDEARPELDALLRKLDAALDAKDAARAKLVADNRAWKWTLTFVPTDAK
jgi:lysophospholipase L1-like esterase